MDHCRTNSSVEGKNKKHVFRHIDAKSWAESIAASREKKKKLSFGYRNVSDWARTIYLVID